MKVLQCDVTKWNEVLHSSELVAQEISDLNLELWAIVNNAGVCVLSEFEWIPLEQYEVSRKHFFTSGFLCDNVGNDNFHAFRT